jgi:hypothetical protein
MPEAEADPPLVAAWLAARSISRHLPVPVPDHGGLRVDTGSETESCRYVFARPVSGLSGLGRTVRDPLTALKLCAGSELMRSMLSPRWDVEETGSFMACNGPMPARAAAAGYRLELTSDHGVIRCIIHARDGSLAASGFAVEQDGVFAFDRIVTEQAHRRRGLAAALVTALAQARSDPASRFVLVATPTGRLLYEALGWSVLSPYSTARLKVTAQCPDP